MSKFLKALEQAQRDRTRALGEERPADDESFGADAARESRAVVPDMAPQRIDARAPEPPTAAAAVSNVKDVEPHLVSLVAPDSFEAEQYRSLRTSLELWREDRRCCVIGISSPAAGDGKTTTAINLAATLTQGGESRVLLVEADLRNPQVASGLGIRTDGAGLVRGLAEEGRSLDQLVCRRPPWTLDLILAGHRVESPYELLKSPRMLRLLEDARERYDYVLLDTPPLVSFADCQVLANWLDGFLVVVAAHRTPRKLVEEALNTIGAEKALGFVFNQDDRPLGGYGYYYSYPGPDSARQGILGAFSGQAWRSPRRKSFPK